MSENETQNEGRPSTEAEKQADIHVQHFNRVFGRDNNERNTSQKYVVEWLKAVQKMPVFARHDGFDATAAALSEGQRILATQIISDAEREPVSKVTKPKVSKG